MSGASGGIPELVTFEIQIAIGITNHHHKLGTTLVFAKWSPDLVLIHQHKRLAIDLFYPVVRERCLEDVNAHSKLTDERQNQVAHALMMYAILKYTLVKNEEIKCRRYKGRGIIISSKVVTKCPACNGTGISDLAYPFAYVYKVSKTTGLSRSAFYRNYSNLANDLFLPCVKRKTTHVGTLRRSPNKEILCLTP